MPLGLGCLWGRSKVRAAPPAGTIDLDTDFVRPQSLVDELEVDPSTGFANVRLLKWEFLHKRALAIDAAKTEEERRALALPRRQQLEEEHPEAFYSAAEVAELRHNNKHTNKYTGGPMGIVVVSHPWATAEHPDPEAKTLVDLVRAIRRAQTSAVARHHALLPGGPRKDGGPPHGLAVFFDWCCLFQKPRTEAQDAVFRAALRNMQLWYAHQLTTVFLMTGGPPGSEGAAEYSSRGWPTFERLAASIGKRTSQWSWPLIVDVGSGSGTASRLPPLTPEAFLSELQDKHFSNGSDLHLVADLYVATVDALVRDATLLKYGGCGWGDAQITQLCAWLPRCTKLGELSLIANQIGDEGAVELARAIESGGLESLHTLQLSENPAIGDAGATALAAALRSNGAPKLRAVGLSNIGARGVAATELLKAEKELGVRYQKELRRRRLEEKLHLKRRGRPAADSVDDSRTSGANAWRKSLPAGALGSANLNLGSHVHNYVHE